MAKRNGERETVGGGDASQNVIRELLRAMPIDQRAEAIVKIFQVIASEFAAMVLEHVKPERQSARDRKWASRIGGGPKSKQRPGR
jgi:hypothetical protein